MNANAGASPPASTRAGSASAPRRPPTGIAVWRIPNARPRSCRGNHGERGGCRRLDARTGGTGGHEQRAGLSASSAKATSAINTPHVASPAERASLADAIRREPWLSSPIVSPSAWPRRGGRRRAGRARTPRAAPARIEGRPIVNVEKLACAAVPAARTAQR